MIVAFSIVLTLAQPSAPAARQIEPKAPETATTASAETSGSTDTLVDVTTEEPAAPAPEPAVSDEAWAAVVGKQVELQTSAGPVAGELASADGANVVVIAPDGHVRSVPKSSVSDMRVSAPAPAVAPAASEPAFPTTAPPPEDSADDDVSDDPAEARKRKRQERRENRKHALLGAYTAHGAAYAHWRGDGINAGYAAYNMDFAIGVNPSERFGMYAVGGGLLGARIDDKSVNANYGRIAFMFAFGGKWYFSTFGAGVGFSRLKFETETQKDVGLSLPMKLFGRIPLPKKLYIGIGLAYDVGIVRQFSRSVHGIGGQIVVGRW